MKIILNTAREDEETLSDLKKYLDSCRLFSDKLTGIMDKVSSQEKSWTDLMNVEVCSI